MSINKQKNALDYLILSNGVRLHHCQVRQQYWLLFPEGAIALNTNAVAILTLCQGNLSFNEIVTELEKQFSNIQQSDIQDFLSYMMQRGLLSQYVDRSGQVNLSARK